MSQLYLIWSVEHSAWWAPKEMGYVYTAKLAGRYERQLAENICERANKFLPNGVINEIAIREDVFSNTAHTKRGVTLMREASELQFTKPKTAAWKAWRASWAARAENWIAESQT